MTFLIYILAFAVLLGVLVTIHEFGHFIFARMFKVHVQRFSIGMGPVFYKKYDKHGTEFALSAIPLGGYVSMITNKLIELEPEVCKQLTEEQMKNTFDSKPKWQRALIMFAGPLANFLLSIFIFTSIFISTIDPQTVPVVEKVYIEESDQVATNVIKLNLASSFEKGDKINAINGVTIKDAKDFNLELLSYAGYTGEINFEVNRNNSPLSVSIKVEDFLPTSESQSNPAEYMGFEVAYKMQPIIGRIVSGGSADNAGLKSNDLVLEIGNERVNYTEDIQNIVSKNPDTTLDFKISRDDNIFDIPVDISSRVVSNETYGVLGVQFGTTRSFWQSFKKGVYETYNLSAKTLQFIGKMVTGNMGTENLSGPIGIAQMAGDTAQAGLLPFMYLMALLSISLAVINLLPIPVLDGGQLTLLGIEAVRGKPLPEKAENMIYTGGTILVVMLMIFAIFNDISRFL